MLPRIWIVVMAVLLLAAPADRTSAEVPDPPSSIGSLYDDDDLGPAVALPAETTPGGLVCAAPLDDGAVLPAPVLARIFRPPRPSRG